MEKDQTMYVRLYPEPTRIAREQPPIARFIIRVEVVNVGYQNLGPHVSPGKDHVFFRFLCFLLCVVLF